jgi:hypothetical protein
MKLLNRLREMWTSRSGQLVDEQGNVSGAVEMDFDEYAFQMGMDEHEFNTMPGVGTLDGLRRRISGVHEDFPPGGVGGVEQGDDDGSA